MIKQELLDEIDRLYDKIADRDQTIEDLEKRVEELEMDLCRAVQWKEDLLNTCDEKDEIIRQYEEELERGEVGWMVSNDKDSYFYRKDPVGFWTEENYKTAGYRIVRVRVTEIPGEVEGE